MSSPVEVSVVLPAYNEENTIERTVEVTLDTLASFLPAGTFEVIVAEDGCDDRTPDIADRLADEDDRVRHIHSDERLGRGGALGYAFRRASGDTLVYFDTDLATDMRHLEELVESVRSGEYDVATGSRWLPENRADRPAKRGVPSYGFNTLVRLFLRSDVQDHQCGFKAFDRAALMDLLDDVEDDHWFWDTELLVRAQREGYRVKEFSVDWTPKGDSKVDVVRDVFGMGSQIVRTWWQLSVSPRLTRRVSLGVGSLLVFVALALMTVYLDPSEVLARMSEADPTLVALAAVVYVFSWPLRGYRYRDILGEIGYREKTGFLTGAIFISQTGNLVFPARAGDAVRAYVVKARRSIPYASGFASLAVERVFDLLTITLLAGTVMLGLVATGQVTDVQSALLGSALGSERAASGQTALYVATGVGLAAIGSVALIVASARSDRNYVRGAVTAISNDSYADYVASVIERFAGDVQTVAGDGRAFARVGASSLLIWSLDVLTALLVFAAFDVNVSLVTLVAVGFFAVSVGNLAKVLPLSPGGVGLYEGAFSLLVVGLIPAVGWEVALGAAIVDHAVKNVVTVLGGVISMGWLNVSLTTAVEESKSASEAEPTPTDD
ncbi:flippase-like domain-containing protein [Haloarculaceae archaeon H-GB2-1]|nr:flippase-like domain-containing protein [Haloarculaceae archaeon H-GB1-1]MEA5387696.1 flippase-like domain-containing protein [Haloarculaceae archaeon H-GB11]MEA5409186.1 flippase-like domain-containing protein [Haloarculaceae archaeon H-GB2-1]